MLKHSESTACTVLQEANLPCSSHSERRLLWTVKENSEVSFQCVLKYLSETWFTCMLLKIHGFFISIAALIARTGRKKFCHRFQNVRLKN